MGCNIKPGPPRDKFEDITRLIGAIIFISQIVLFFGLGIYWFVSDFFKG